jgi:hypothetical protein
VALAAYKSKMLELVFRSHPLKQSPLIDAAGDALNSSDLLRLA